MATKKRREKGDGSIYQRSSDGMYVAYTRLADGQKKYVYAKTRKEVAAKLKELQANIERGLHVAKRADTVETYLRYWLQIHRTQIKYSTYVSYSGHLKLVYAHIGKIKLQKLQTDQIQAMYADLAGYIEPNTICLLHRIIKTAFKAAVKWKMLAANPCQAAEPPQAEKHNSSVLTPDQCLTLLATAKSSNMECFVTLALGLAMRRGELLALRWADIDIEKQIVHVDRTASYLVDETTGKHAYTVTSPKTASGRRSIQIPAFIIPILKSHKVQQTTARLKAGEWEDKDLVFPGLHGNTISLGSLRLRFKKLLEAAGLPDIRIHDLRHSSATLLLSMGVPAKVVSEILGHSSIQITMDIYGHVLPTMQEDAMGKMDRFFSQK
jgi:integrase